MRLPTGPAVTFLFTDIEGSTRLERAVGSAAWAALVARHDRLVRDAIESADGVVVKTEGDAFFAAFAAPAAAIRAAVAAQRALAAESWGEAPIRVRMGLHLGQGRLREGSAPTEAEDYVGIDVNYAARVAATGNGGQVVLSDALATAIAAVVGSADDLLGAELVDEGLRIVKDFDEPARLHRLVVPGAADDPRPLRTIDPPSNLPGEVTALVGREIEISLAREALLASRIVTLTGPGGSGKTRLALGVARSLADRFPHGTWFVDLAALRDPELIETNIASAMGVRESSDAAVADALRQMLRDRSALIVLDNLEQLLPGAADVVSGLLRAAPGVRILATSRELLRITGERGYPVPPLDVSAGMTLFLERARAHRPDLARSPETEATIRAICERLGGLPLAIELAAARSRTLSPVMILERLGRSLDLTASARDLPERQRTLRGAIDWSHDLLSDPERRLFRRLGVFAGGWTPEMAEGVVDPDHDLGVDLLDGLESLTDKSLIRVEPPSGEAAPAGEPVPVEDEIRFGIHPLLREYALERLAESGELPLFEARHADAITALAERLGRGISGPNATAILARLDREAFNLRAALDWSIDNDAPDLGLRLSGSVWRWYHQRNHLREGKAILGELLGRTPHGDPRVRIGGLAAQGSLAYWLSDVDLAAAAYRERLDLAETIGEPQLLGDAHYDIGFISMLRKDGATLRRHEEEAIARYAEAGDVAGTIRARQALGLAEFLAGSYERALELEQENVRAFRATTSNNEVADSLTFTTAVHMELGQYAAGWATFREALELFAGTNNASGLARSLGIAALLFLQHGDPELGARVTGAAYELVRVHGVMMAPVTVLHLPDPRVVAVERLGAERAEALMAAGAATELEEIVRELLAMTRGFVEPPVASARSGSSDASEA